MAQIEVHPDTAHLNRAAAERFVHLAQAATATQGSFAVALSGGSTPTGMYGLLATPEFADRVDWARIHVFWGDERSVAPDHVDSNYRMACDSLLRHVPLAEENIHRIPAELEPEQAATSYEEVLRRVFTGDLPKRVKLGEDMGPSFDLILLGMGEDGHTASLFPAGQAIREEQHWVVADYVAKLAAWRITLTPAVINAAAHVVFLVAGNSKSKMLQQVLQGPFQPGVVSAQAVYPTSGQLLWLVDTAAGALLSGSDDVRK